MNDLISRQAVLECFEWTNTKAGAKHAIETLPSVQTVDAVQVVRCEYCRYWNDVHSTEKPSYCRLMDIFPTKDFYCKNGRRKDYDN